MAARSLKIPRVLLLVGFVGVIAGMTTQLIIAFWGHWPGVTGVIDILWQVVSIPAGVLVVCLAWWLFGATIGSGPIPERAFRRCSLGLAVAALLFSTFYFGEAHQLAHAHAAEAHFGGSTLFPHFRSLFLSYVSEAIGLVLTAVGYACASRFAMSDPESPREQPTLVGTL